MADDIAKLAQMLGVDPASLANLGGQSSSSADDPPIYFGKQAGYGASGFDTELGAHQHKGTADVTKPFSQYTLDFYKLDRTALTQFQSRAYQAGLYGNAKPRYGDPNDDVAYSIWQDIGKRAAGFTAAGQKFTPGDVLDMAVQSTPADQRQARAYQTRVDVVQTQDPATIRQAAHDAFKEATGRGRKQGDPVVERFVKAFTARQVGAQQTVNRAQDQSELAYRAAQDSADAGGSPGSGAVSRAVRVSTPDLGADAAAFAQQTAPGEVGAHGVAKQFDTFLKLLGGVV